jgi:DNA-binding transcriptional MerR regulator
MTGSHYSIGEFARRSRLTVTTLRHYDATGVLVPAFVDPATGYRYYDDAQIVAGSWLAVLRELGVPVADLRALGTGASSVAAVLAAHRARLAEGVDEHHRRLAALDALMGDGGPGEIVVRETLAQERRVASIGLATAWDRVDAATRHGVARLDVLLRRTGTTAATKGAVFPVDPHDRFVLHVYADIPYPLTVAGSTELTLPGGPCLETAFAGSRSLAGFAYRALLARGGDVAAVTEDYEWSADGRPLTRLRAMPAGWSAC